MADDLKIRLNRENKQRTLESKPPRFVKENVPLIAKAVIVTVPVISSTSLLPIHEDV